MIYAKTKPVKEIYANTKQVYEVWANNKLAFYHPGSPARINYSAGYFDGISTSTTANYLKNLQGGKYFTFDNNKTHLLADTTYYLVPQESYSTVGSPIFAGAGAYVYKINNTYYTYYGLTDLPSKKIIGIFVRSNSLTAEIDNALRTDYIKWECVNVNTMQFKFSFNVGSISGNSDLYNYNVSGGAQYANMLLYRKPENNNKWVATVWVTDSNNSIMASNKSSGNKYYLEHEIADCDLQDLVSSYNTLYVHTSSSVNAKTGVAAIAFSSL